MNNQEVILPAIIGTNIKLILMAGEGGYLLYWRDLESLKNSNINCLRAHNSQISCIQLSEN